MMLVRARRLLIGGAGLVLLLGISASAAISPKILAKPNVRHNVLVSFNAPPLPEGGYYYAVIVLEPYGHYTRQHPPPCSVSSDMQRTDYGYSESGRVSLALTPTTSHARHWCLGGSYEGAIYAVPHARPCESAYPCSSEPYEPPKSCGNGGVCGVVVRPLAWRYPDRLPRPEAKGSKIVGWFVVRFRSHHH